VKIAYFVISGKFYLPIFEFSHEVMMYQQNEFKQTVVDELEEVLDQGMLVKRKLNLCEAEERRKKFKNDEQTKNPFVKDDNCVLFCDTNKNMSKTLFTCILITAEVKVDILRNWEKIISHQLNLT
jgi:hypothetical protein